MKKTFLIIGAAMLALSGFTQDIGISGGIQLALPVGDLARVTSIGFGLDANGHIPVTDNIEGVATLSFHRFGGSENTNLGFGSGDIKYSYSVIGIQAGGRYYLEPASEGIFFGAALGLHPVTVKIDYSKELEESTSFFGTSFFQDTKDTSIGFGFDIGGGYTVNQLDLKLHYQIVSADGGSFSFLGFGGAYRFM